MAEDVRQYLGAAAFLTAGGLAACTAWACHRATRRESPTAESGIWAAVALVFLLLAWVEVARPGQWLGLAARQFARSHGLYEHHRLYQIVATAAVACVALALLLIGLLSARDYLRRHRLAIGCAGVVVSYGVIRFVSLEEMDKWSDARPWARVVVAVVMALMTSSAAVARYRRIRSRE
jgi:hypothetical protein